MPPAAAAVYRAAARARKRMLLLVGFAVAALPVMDPVAYSWCAPPAGACPTLVTAAGFGLCCFDAEPAPRALASCAPLTAGTTLCGLVVTAGDAAWCCDDAPTTTSWPTDGPHFAGKPGGP